MNEVKTKLKNRENAFMTKNSVGMSISLKIPRTSSYQKLNQWNQPYSLHSTFFRYVCEICSKLAIKTPERRHWCCSGVFIVNFKQILSLNMWQVPSNKKLFRKMFFTKLFWPWSFLYLDVTVGKMCLGIIRHS